jgi:lipopolysaccharide biosynthesis glycosyltransferase
MPMPTISTPAAVIPIVIVTDEHYIIHLAALLRSIEANHNTPEKIAVYVISDGVKPRSKRKTQDCIDPNKTSLTWVATADAIPAGIALPLDRTSYPLTIYLRLFIQHIVPADTQKVVFMDVDMIMLEDVSKLYYQDLGTNIIAAVQDPRLLTFDNNWGGILNYQALGFAPDTLYFNTGLIIFDIPKWKAGNFTQKVIECINQNLEFANYPDQYGFNVVLANQWLKLDTRWNYFASGDIPHPYIIHFISRKPFYKSYNYNPTYQKLFYSYLKQTPWRGTRPIGELNRYIKKLTNVYTKIKSKVLK